MKKENEIKGNYAEDFLSYLDDSLLEKGFAKEIKHLRGGAGGYRAGIGPGGDEGTSSIYRLSENPKVGLRVLTQKDFGYNQKPKEWSFVRTFIIPWEDVKKIKENSESDIRGEEIEEGSYMATSEREFRDYKTFKELEGEILGDFNKSTHKKTDSKTLDKLLSIVTISLFLLGILFIFPSITGNSINLLNYQRQNLIGISLILISLIMLFVKLKSRIRRGRNKIKKLELI